MTIVIVYITADPSSSPVPRVASSQTCRTVLCTKYGGPAWLTWYFQRTGAYFPHLTRSNQTNWLHLMVGEFHHVSIGVSDGPCSYQSNHWLKVQLSLCSGITCCPDSTIIIRVWHVGNCDSSHCVLTNSLCLRYHSSYGFTPQSLVLWA